LILTKYLNQPDLGQNLSLVQLDEYNYPSYSGFFTVSEKYNSNMFFWFFPAQNGDPNAPILMWLQGGPGGSSLFGLFSEMGPFSVDANAEDLIMNPYTWNSKYAMLFVDNPVGVGFSFTDSPDGFSTNTHEEVAENLYKMLIQFFTIFYEYQSNDFYVTGESYGGKYVPSCAYKIHQMNEKSKQKINLKGIAVGDGIFDPLIQFTGFADLLYHLGLADENQMAVINDYETAMAEGIAAGNWTQAFRPFDEFLNGDFYPYPTYFVNITGNGNYFNFLDFKYPPNPYPQFVDSPSVRQQLHVGTVPYFSFNQTVELYLINDWMKSVAFMLPTLMNNYNVMLYNGQVDIILGGPLAERLYWSIPWEGLLQYRNTPRMIWSIDNSGFPAGYVRQVQLSNGSGSFTQVIVREAGHLLPLDQPIRALAMITNFVDGTPFKSASPQKQKPKY